MRLPNTSIEDKRYTEAAPTMLTRAGILAQTNIESNIEANIKSDFISDIDQQKSPIPQELIAD